MQRHSHTNIKEWVYETALSHTNIKEWVYEMALSHKHQGVGP